MIDNVSANIGKFLELRESTGLHLSLRITPSILSIYHLDTVFKLMLDKKIIAESCNILHDPGCLRLELLPEDLLSQVKEKINQIITEFDLIETDDTIINRRVEESIDLVISQVIFEYKHLLENLVIPNNVEQDRHDLVKYLKAFEQVHNNNILDYLPEYEEFLRSYGY
jgi:hypothetical protein